MATDELGNIGIGSTDMKLFGAGMYVHSSRDVSNSTVANNTLLMFASSSCYNCLLSFHCYSNSTTDNYRPSVLYAYGKMFPNTSESYLTVLEASPSGLFVHNRGRNRLEGVYTCEIADSKENVIFLTIGVYGSLNPPNIYDINYIKQFQTISNVLMTIHCTTRNHLPTFIVWYRNGKVIEVDGNRYTALETVTSRRYSISQYTLVVHDVAGVIERPVYTCVVGNTAGNHSTTVTIDTTVTLSLAVDITPDVIIRDYDVGFFNREHTLVCAGVITSSILPEILHLENYTHVEWSDSSGIILARENITVKNLLSSTNGIMKSMLSFRPLSKGHDQLYTCSMTVDIETFIRSDASPYRLIVDVAYFHVKSDVISCSTVTSGRQVAAQLEGDIKDALVLFINRECRCGFLTSMIDRGEFNCHNDNFVGYRARLVGGSDTLSSHKLVEILNKWKFTDGTFIYTGGTLKKRVWVDMPCPLEISSLSAAVCD